MGSPDRNNLSGAFLPRRQEAVNWGCAWEDQTAICPAGAFASPAEQTHGILKHFLPGSAVVRNTVIILHRCSLQAQGGHRVRTL